jgi:uncharacterized protein YbaR (Trm112 family)
MNGKRTNGIVRLNVGGKIYQTTSETLFSKGPNFFSAILNNEGSISSTVDETGAIFVDRNGRLFEAILDYLRTGSLIVPPTMSLEAILREAAFYCIDVTQALCHIRPGLYSSSGGRGMSQIGDTHSWLLLVQRDPSRPNQVGVTGIFGSCIVYEKSCPLLPGGIIVLKHKAESRKHSPSSDDLHLHICLSEEDPTGQTLICRDATRWYSIRTLSWKQEPNDPLKDEFPLPFDAVWSFSPGPDGQSRGGKAQVRFDPSQEREANGDVLMRIVYPDGVHSWWIVTPLCRSLLLVRSASSPIGLIYISGCVVFFIESNSGTEFAVHALRNITSAPLLSSPPSPPPTGVNTLQAPMTGIVY